MAREYKTLAIKTRYWKPNYDYTKDIIEAIKPVITDGDYVTISEKAISTALGNIVDEKNIKPTSLSICIAKYWMRIVWPYVLGPVCHLRKRTIDYLRSYPVEEGSRHKQLALQRGGFLQALMHGSESGIDGSNLPLSYVCLPLENAEDIVTELQELIYNETGKTVSVAVVDTDKTYSLNGFHFTPRPKPIKGIFSIGGFFAYVVGWSLKLQKRATPLALSGSKLPTDDAIEIAKIANRTRGAGSGRTVWDMAKNFKVGLTEVTWEMLEQTDHHPVVIIRFKVKKSKTHKNEY